MGRRVEGGRKGVGEREREWTRGGSEWGGKRVMGRYGGQGSVGEWEWGGGGEGAKKGGDGFEGTGQWLGRNRLPPALRQNNHLMVR